MLSSPRGQSILCPPVFVLNILLLLITPLNRRVRVVGISFYLPFPFFQIIPSPSEINYSDVEPEEDEEGDKEEEEEECEDDDEFLERMQRRHQLPRPLRNDNNENNLLLFPLSSPSHSFPPCGPKPNRSQRGNGDHGQERLSARGEALSNGPVDPARSTSLCCRRMGGRRRRDGEESADGPGQGVAAAAARQGGGGGGGLMPPVFRGLASDEQRRMKGGGGSGRRKRKTRRFEPEEEDYVSWIKITAAVAVGV